MNKINSRDDNIEDILVWQLYKTHEKKDEMEGKAEESFEELDEYTQKIYKSILTGSWENTMEIPKYLFERYRNQIENTLSSIYGWFDIELPDDKWNDGDMSRIWVEILADWWICLYFPLNNESWETFEELRFSPKEVKTMYLAALESLCFESKSSASREISYSEE